MKFRLLESYFTAGFEESTKWIGSVLPSTLIFHIHAYTAAAADETYKSVTHVLYIHMLS